ncbi:MAG: ABC transporter ATP-binding protein [Cytophagales bacterium]
MTTTEPIITTHDLAVGYQTKAEPHVLFDGLNLSLYRGQLVCFMGPNGIGKSTLLRTLMGTHKPLGGTVAGVDPKQVAVVLTDRVSNAMMTVKDLVTYGRYPYLDWSIKLTTSDQEAIASAVNQVGIAHLMHHRIDQLSDGQLQMVMIAKALAQETPALLLDEPTAHLDLNNRVEIMNLLKKLAHQHNRALLVTTHELDLALQTADLIWLANNQKSIVTGIPEDLVLQNAFDDVFRFKGFDLKSGKVIHDAYRKTSIKVTGNGHAFLWTKNALERNGYITSDESQDLSIEVKDMNPIAWEIEMNGTKQIVQSIAALLFEVENRMP